MVSRIRQATSRSSIGADPKLKIPAMAHISSDSSNGGGEPLSTPSDVGDRSRFSSGTALPHHRLDGFDQNQQVQPERDVLDVEQVVLKLLDRILDAGGVRVVDLSPARESWLQDVSLAE